MPCPACGQDPAGTTYKPDPLQWELDPPCSEDEWNLLKVLAGAPQYMQDTKFEVYKNNVCRGCYNQRMEVRTKVREHIRDRGGIENLRPSKKALEEYEATHQHEVHAGKSARIHGLQNEAAIQLNGQYCKLLTQDSESKRWTVQLINGDQKSIKTENLECSLEIQAQWGQLRMKYLREHPEKLTGGDAPVRPLGAYTSWPKIKGIHPGAVVRLKDLSVPELNGRKGRCIRFDPEKGRWKIDLGDEYKGIKPDNLVPAPTERPPTRESAAAEKKEWEDKKGRRAQMSAKERFAEDYGWED